MINKIKAITLILIITLLLIPHKILANTVEYRGESEGLIITPNDFFLEFGELLPGDKKSDIAYIKNNTKDKIEVFFKTEPLSKTEYYDDIDYSLLEKITLKITLKHNNEEKLIYEGNLGASNISEYISLGEYEKNYDGEFKFEIKVPENLKNEYTLSSTKVKWVFYVEKHEESKSPSTDDETPNGSSTDDIIPGGSTLGDFITGNIKTGDYVFIFGAIALISIIVIAITIKLKNKKK